MPRGLPIAAAPLALMTFAACLPSAGGADASLAEESLDASLAEALGGRCLHCHNADYSEAGLRLDPGAIANASAEFWKLALTRVERGEMPPADEGPLSSEERRSLEAGLSARLRDALRREPAPPPPLVRRLTKRQYAETLHQLFGVPRCLADDLPADSRSELGFSTGVSAEQTSMLHVEYYQAIARRVLRRALPAGPKPAAAHYRVTLGKDRFPDSAAAMIGGFQAQPVPRRHVGVEVLGLHATPGKRRRDRGRNPAAAVIKDIGVGMRGSAKSRYRVVGDGMLLQPALPHKEVAPHAWRAPSPNLKALVRRRYPTAGPFVLRVRARPADDAAEAARSPRLQAFAGGRTDDGLEYAEVGASTPVTASDGPGGWRTYEFHGDLEAVPLPVVDPVETGPLAGILIVGVWNDCLVRSRRATTPGVVIGSVELLAPAYRQWPPASHRQVFGDAPGGPPTDAGRERPGGGGRLAIDVLRRTLPRLFRRPVSGAEVARYARFWRSVRGDFTSDEGAIRETLVAALCSPAFLYIGAPAPHLSAQQHAEYTLASRLAYFLWGGPPDRRLLDLAAAGRLRQELPQQVERMVRSPRAMRFVEGFVGEWLRLDRHEAMSTNAGRFPRYNRFVKEAMGDEVRHFFRHVLVNNRPVEELISAEYTMLNRTLAEFYGVPGVAGEELAPTRVLGARPVGGLLGQGAMLAGHSDGTQPHAIKRAVWLRSRVLGDPPPEAPPNVPELAEPTGDNADLSLTQRLALHRDRASCRSCHAGIDPFGVPLEQFDAVGRLAKKAQSLAELPDGTHVDGVLALRDYLLRERRRDLIRSVAMHLFAYATGIDPGVHDEAVIGRIAAAAEGGGLRDVVAAVAASEAFLTTQRTAYAAGARR